MKTYLLEKYSKKELLELLYVVSFLNSQFKTDYIPMPSDDGSVSSDDSVVLTKEKK